MLVRRKAIAQNDIFCYKMLIVKDYNFCSPYRQYFIWNMGEVMNDPTPGIVKNKKRAGSHVITKGCFHSYSSLSYAEHALERFIKKNKDYNVYLFHAIIPKGTEYYSSCCGEFCSRTLKILDQYVPDN